MGRLLTPWWLVGLSGTALIVMGVLTWYGMHARTQGTDELTSGSRSGAAEDAAAARPVESGESKGEVEVEQALWTAVGEGTVADLPRYAPEWSVEARVLVSVSDVAAAAPNWRIGDTLALPIPQIGATYRPVIEEIDDAVGARAVLGWISGDDGRRRLFVVTVGPMNLFAFIDTPQGSYELLADHRYGWLLPSSSMKAGWDYSEPDFTLPNGDGT
ncbi:MAG: hypothetical protein F4X98_11330 [Gammaproteobacteria bacterium]|nr:hypothetical protein [Gammaproteobacteria bacterium]